jgi:hypothetical protein
LRSCASCGLKETVSKSSPILLRVPQGCERVARGQAQPMECSAKKPCALKVARPLSLFTNVLCLASLQDAVGFANDSQGLRFACPWLPSSTPSEWAFDDDATLVGRQTRPPQRHLTTNI